MKTYNAGTSYTAKRTYPKYDKDHKFSYINHDLWKFWCDNGYLKIENVIPKDKCSKLMDQIWKYIDGDPNSPTTWYNIPASNEKNITKKSIAGMVELYHHQYMWDIRESEKLYNIFCDLWGKEELWVTIDRVNANMPNNNEWEFDGFLHWDVDLSKNQNVRNIQGVVSLNDSNSGGLQLIPELFKEIKDNRFDSEINQLSFDNRHHFSNIFENYDVLNVESNAGDLILWDSRMVHGTSPNKGKIPRFAQYVSMIPEEYDNKELLQIRINSFKNRSGPEKCGMPGNTDEKYMFEPPILSMHGEKLLGKIPWK